MNYGWQKGRIHNNQDKFYKTMSKVNSISVTIEYDYPGYCLYPKFQEEQSKYKLTTEKKEKS